MAQQNATSKRRKLDSSDVDQQTPTSTTEIANTVSAGIDTTPVVTGAAVPLPGAPTAPERSTTHPIQSLEATDAAIDQEIGSKDVGEVGQDAVGTEDNSDNSREDAEIGGFEPQSHYKLVQRPSRIYRNVVVEKTWKIEIFKPVTGTDMEIMEKTHAILQHAIAEMLKHAVPGSVAQLFLENQRLYGGMRASKRGPAGALDATDVLEQFAAAIQSSKMRHQEAVAEGEGEDDSSVIELQDTEFTLVYFQERKLGSIHTRKEVQMKEYVRKSRSLLDPSNPGYRVPKVLANSCLMVCVVAGVAREKSKTSGNVAVQLLQYLRTK